MLKKTEKITVTGESIINDKVVCTFAATIDLAEPEKMSINQFQKDKEAYRANRAACRADYAQFEDHVFALQAEIKADNEAASA